MPRHPMREGTRSAVICPHLLATPRQDFMMRPPDDGDAAVGRPPLAQILCLACHAETDASRQPEPSLTCLDCFMDAVWGPTEDAVHG